VVRLCFILGMSYLLLRCKPAHELACDHKHAALCCAAQVCVVLLCWTRTHIYMLLLCQTAHKYAALCCSTRRCVVLLCFILRIEWAI
jgi:hypothetical protein